jgi:hypothetical protein
MSGIGQGHNKFVTCKGCLDRTVEPNCHTVCKGYLYRTKKRQTINDIKRVDEYWGYRHDKYEKSQR